MDHLPAELLHVILQHLSLQDVCSVRLACQTLRDVGRSHLIREIYLLPTTPSLQRLQEISQNPAFRAYVSSLFFEADTIRHTNTYDDWYGRIPSDSMREHRLSTPPSFHIHSSFSESWLHATARCTSLRDQHCRPPMSVPHMDTALDDGISDPSNDGALDCVYYNSFLGLASDIKSLYENHTYAPILRDAIALLPALKHVSLSIQAGLRPRPAKFYSVFEKGLIVPFCDERQQPRQGEQQLFGLLEAVAAANTKLESLEIAYVNVRVLYQDEHPERMLLWGAQMASLKRLTLGISMGHLFDSYYRRTAAQLNVQRLRTSGVLVKLLACAPLLRYLSVRFDWDDPYPAELEDIVGDMTWPHLREVEFAYVYTARHTLENFYARHGTSLRVLKLTHVAFFVPQEDDDALRDNYSRFKENWEGFRAASQELREKDLRFGWSELSDREGRWVNVELCKN